MQELERALAGNPDTIFILAHRSDLEMMKRHPNLWGEVGCHRWSPSYGEAGSLSDRIVVGTDFSDPSVKIRDKHGHKTPQRAYAETIACIRKELGRLQPAAAKKVAYENLQKLLTRQD